MKDACIWDVLGRILSKSTCNKRNMEFSPQVSINKQMWNTLHIQIYTGVSQSVICWSPEWTEERECDLKPHTATDNSYHRPAEIQPRSLS